jgi:hypothetical protein
MGLAPIFCFRVFWSRRQAIIVNILDYLIVQSLCSCHRLAPYGTTVLDNGNV